MNRITVQSGYDLPFDEYGRVPGGRSKKRKGRRGLKQSAAVKRMQSKMKACARKWRGMRKSGGYRAFMKSCLRG